MFASTVKLTSLFSSKAAQTLTITSYAPCAFSFRKANASSLSHLNLKVEAVVLLVYWPMVLLSPSFIMRMVEPRTLARVSPQIALSVAQVKLGLMIPFSIDFSLHAVPALALLTDFLLLEQKFTEKASRLATPIIILYTLTYGAWVEFCAIMNGGTCKSLEDRVLITYNS